MRAELSTEQAAASNWCKFMSSCMSELAHRACAQRGVCAEMGHHMSILRGGAIEGVRREGKLQRHSA
eukprot:9072583-Karenia_brevis.AAC.1